MKRLVRRRLVWRLYAIGLVQLLLVAFFAVLMGFAVMKLTPNWDAAAFVQHIKPLLDKPAALEHELVAIRTRSELLISLYDEERRLIASNVHPPLRAPSWGNLRNPIAAVSASGAPPPAPPSLFSRNSPIGSALPFLVRRGPIRGRPPGFDTFAHFDLNGRDGLLIARFEHPRSHLLLPLLTLLSGLVVVGVGAFATARSIGRPLKQLSEAATALGSGDFRVRANLKRADELGDVAHAFDDMAQRLQALVQAEKELLANVAHELRTPLARIRVALEIAGEGDAAVARSSLGEIAVDLAELETLIDDVLTATRLGLSGEELLPARLALHLQVIQADVIAERAFERFRVRFPQRELRLQLPKQAPEIEVDAVLFRRVIDNLLENAVKYSAPESGAILLSVSAAQGWVHFEVADHGIGIAQEDLTQIFTPFFRAERSRSRGTGGVGLGLTLVKRIVEAHAGKIDVQSTLGGGTKINVSVLAVAENKP